MEELSIIKEFTSLGVGGVIAVIMFYFYRNDRRDTQKRLSEMIKHDMQTRESQTIIFTELVVLLKNLNGRLK